MNYDLLSFFIFIVLISIFLYVKRKHLDLQKLLFPVFYLLLYRTNFGINFIDRVVKKYKELIKLIGYICIGFSFLGIKFIFGFVFSNRPLEVIRKNDQQL